MDVICLPLNCGANIEATDVNGKTPALFAIFNEQESVIRLLHESGANMERWTDSTEIRCFARRKEEVLFSFVC